MSKQKEPNGGVKANDNMTPPRADISESHLPSSPTCLPSLFLSLLFTKGQTMAVDCKLPRMLPAVIGLHKSADHLGLLSPPPSPAHFLVNSLTCDADRPSKTHEELIRAQSSAMSGSDVENAGVDLGSALDKLHVGDADGFNNAPGIGEPSAGGPAGGDGTKKCRRYVIVPRLSFK